MTIYTDAEARQQLDGVLERARAEGEVTIRRADGQEFVIRPTSRGTSALNVGTVKLGVSSDEIVKIIRENRERSPE